MFDPKTNKFPYPEDTGVHYLHVKKDNGNVYDASYPYYDNSFGFRFKQFFFRIILVCIAFPVQAIRMGFRIKGKENLRKHKEEIRKGVVSVSNHIHMWDYIGIMNAVSPFKTRIIAWDKNISGENGKMIRMVGGVPVPTDPRGMIKMCRDTIDFLKEGGWMHVMAEGTMWEYYGQIRPFKEGAAYYAYKANRPILPLCYTFNPVKGIRKLFKQIATLTLNIGEPIYPDMSLPKDESIKKLTIDAHAAICKLSGHEDGKSIYQPIYGPETSKRIDYYTTEYGVGYKGSW